MAPEPFIEFAPNLILGFVVGLPLCVPNFKVIGIRMCFIAIFQSVQKDE